MPFQGRGLLGILPWVLPGVIGTAGLFVWQRHYRRKFGDLRRRPTPTPAG